jgi:hypothetical protein
MSTGGGASLEFLEGRCSWSGRLGGRMRVTAQRAASFDRGRASLMLPLNLNFEFLIVDKERKLIIAGNWKMNKTVAEALDLVNGIKRELNTIKEVDIVICPPFTRWARFQSRADSNIRLGAQNMSEQNFGALTGEICAGMLKEFSVRYVIVGHWSAASFWASPTS